MSLHPPTLLLTIAALITLPIHAEERIELETTIIKGNKELPKILFIVPWQDAKHSKNEEQPLIIHSLYGDLFDPIAPYILNNTPNNNDAE